MKAHEAEAYAKNEMRWRVEMLVRADQTTWFLKLIEGHLALLAGQVRSRQMATNLSEHPGPVGGRNS